MYRVDHAAFRVASRKATAKFFQEALGYKIQEEFEIKFDDGSTAKCIALEPSEKTKPGLPWSSMVSIGNDLIRYDLPFEIFVSDGEPGSIVGEWVKARGGIGGLHHLAFSVDSVEETVKEWKEKGYAEFASEDVLKCEGITQIFTKPSSLTGCIFEFIARGERGFCSSNVKSLMESTKGL